MTDTIDGQWQVTASGATAYDFQSFMHYFGQVAGQYPWHVTPSGAIQARNGRSVLDVAQSHQIALRDEDRPIVVRAIMAPLPILSVSRQPYDGPYMHQYVRERVLKVTGLAK